jgi:long-subunit acyl-CoA synthetase (AMP-forming)
MEANPMSFNTFHGMLRESAAKYGDATAILYDTHAITYDKLFSDCCKKAVHLKKFPGRRIALIGPDSYRFLVNFFGAVMAGKDVCMLDSFLAVTERHILLEKAHPDYILSSTNQYILADAHGEIMPEALKGEDSIDEASLGDNPCEGNVLLFTSGTSRLAKIAVLSSKNLAFSLQQLSEAVPCTTADRVLSLLPLSHVFGLVYSILWPLGCGACVCIGRGIRHMDFDAIYYNPTILPVYPALLETLMRYRGLNDRLHTILIGESHCPDGIINALENEGYQVYSIYGMTAASGCIAVSSKASGHELVPLKGVSISIADDGEILVSGDGLMSHYDGEPEATAQVLDGTTLHSGDLGHIDDEGHLIITGNKKNILALPNGEKMNCLEVESFFNRNDSIDETALTLCDGLATIWIHASSKSFNDEDATRIVNAFNKTKCSARHINRFYITNRKLPRDAAGNLRRSELAAAH